MKDYLDADCSIQAILPTDNKRDFVAMFLSKDAYYKDDMNAYNSKLFRNGYAYQIEEKDNKHGLSAVKIYFMADQSIYDYMLAPSVENQLQDVCEDLQIKRLLAYGKNENDGLEESVQFDYKGKFVYQSRDLYPDPFFDCYLSENERLSDETECMG